MYVEGTSQKIATAPQASLDSSSANRKPANFFSPALSLPQNRHLERAGSRETRDRGAAARTGRRKRPPTLKCPIFAGRPALAKRVYRHVPIGKRQWPLSSERVSQLDWQGLVPRAYRHRENIQPSFPKATPQNHPHIRPPARSLSVFRSLSPAAQASAKSRLWCFPL